MSVLFTIHYEFITGLTPYGTNLTMFSQIAFAFLFYGLIYFLDPKAKRATRPTMPKEEYGVGLPLCSFVTMPLAVTVLIGILASLLGF